jgi:isoleucyl-tRNA synthetase
MAVRLTNSLYLDGFTVDAQGRKMSKSAFNAVAPAGKVSESLGAGIAVVGCLD